jgi:hypothetical protein
MGNISDAKEMASKSRKQRVAIFGADSEEALDSTGMLAIAYGLEGRWEEAEKLQVQVMEARKTKLSNYPTMKSAVGLADLASCHPQAMVASLSKSRSERWLGSTAPQDL